MIPDFGPAAEAAIDAAAAEFPGEFKLRAFKETFRISRSESYVSQGQVILYVAKQNSAGEWWGMVKGTPAELRRQIVR
jgi:hypothetical protein